MIEESKFRILIVEDDEQLAVMVAAFLSAQGFQVEVEQRGDRAVDRIAADPPDAVVLDVNLPGLDGFSVCRAVRPTYEGTILILTARGEEVDEVVGLEVGADDYMSKPVRPHALVARLRLHLKKAPHAPDDDSDVERVEVGSLVVDPARREARLGNEKLSLTSAEFDLLWLLAQNAGKVLSRNEIYQQIHGLRYDGVDRSIDLRVSRIRKKLGDDPTKPERIKSVRGVGYILTAEQ